MNLLDSIWRTPAADVDEDEPVLVVDAREAVAIVVDHRSGSAHLLVLEVVDFYEVSA